MGTSALTLIEAGIVARLRTRMGAEVQVDSYGGQLDDDAFEWVRRVPAVWVTFDRMLSSTRTGPRSFTKVGQWAVIAAQRAFHEPQRRLGVADGTGVNRGVYQLLEDAMAALALRTLELPIGELEPGLVVPVFQGRPQAEAMAVFMQTVKTKWTERYDEPELDRPGILERIGLAYHLQPDDGQADASDLVEIPE